MPSIACVLIAHFAFWVEVARHRAQPKQPVFLIRREGALVVVADTSPVTMDIAPGTPIATATAHHKDALLLECDLTHYQEAWNHVLDALEQKSPVVEDAGVGTAYVGLDGLDELYGGSARVAQAVLTAVDQHYPVQLGVGPNKFLSYLAALQAADRSAFQIPPTIRAFLSFLSVDFLPVPWEMRRRLHAYALHTLGDVAKHPVGPLQAQFGTQGKHAWQLAQGIDPRPLVPRPHTEPVAAHHTFPAPTAQLARVQLSAEALLDTIFLRLQTRRLYARGLEMRGQVEKHDDWQRRLTFPEPVGSKAASLTLVRTALAELKLPGPLLDLRIEALDLTSESARQTSLFSDVRAQEQLADTIKQMTARIGNPKLIFQYREVEPSSRIPEHRRVRVWIGT